MSDHSNLPELVQVWGDLTPPYSTIVADPPWRQPSGGPRGAGKMGKPWNAGRPSHLPYSTMTVDEVAALPVAATANKDAHLYLWTTNHHLKGAYTVAEAWGFRPSQVLTWCKPPQGIGLGGAFTSTTEFVLYCRRGSLPCQDRIESTWFHASRRTHSQKPEVFFEWVHKVSPGPYLELFARQPRLGWDSWGYGFEVVS